jgi:hypothetical protein
MFSSPNVRNPKFPAHCLACKSEFRNRPRTERDENSENALALGKLDHFDQLREADGCITMNLSFIRPFHGLFFH